MIVDAHRIISHGGMKFPKTGAKPGPKEAAFPNPDVEAMALKLWTSGDISSDKAAIRIIRMLWPVVTDRLVRKLGASGRKS
jgi:hypothetical protein